MVSSLFNNFFSFLDSIPIYSVSIILQVFLFHAFKNFQENSDLFRFIRIEFELAGIYVAWKWREETGDSRVQLLKFINFGL